MGLQYNIEEKPVVILYILLDYQSACIYTKTEAKAHEEPGYISLYSSIRYIGFGIGLEYSRPRFKDTKIKDTPRRKDTTIFRNRVSRRIQYTIGGVTLFMSRDPFEPAPADKERLACCALHTENKGRSAAASAVCSCSTVQ